MGRPFLVNFNPHIHVLAADGAFLPDGRVVRLPAVPGSLLAEGFRRAVLEFLVNNRSRLALFLYYSVITLTPAPA